MNWGTKASARVQPGGDITTGWTSGTLYNHRCGILIKAHKTVAFLLLLLRRGPSLQAAAPRREHEMKHKRLFTQSKSTLDQLPHCHRPSPMS